MCHPVLSGATELGSKMVATRSPAVPRELCAILKVLASQLRRFPFLPLAAADRPNLLPQPPVSMNALRNRQRGRAPFKELRHLSDAIFGRGMGERYVNPIK